MGRYTIEISKEALADLLKIKKSGKKTDITKIQKNIPRVRNTPYSRNWETRKAKI